MLGKVLQPTTAKSNALPFLADRLVFYSQFTPKSPSLGKKSALLLESPGSEQI